MAIIHRRGSWADFDPGKLKPGEWAVIQSGDPSTSNGKGVYICLASGVVQRVATHTELTDYEAAVKAQADLAEASVAQASAILETINQMLTEVESKAETAIEALSTADVNELVRKATAAKLSLQDTIASASGIQNQISAVQSATADIADAKAKAVKNAADIAEIKAGQTAVVVSSD